MIELLQYSFFTHAIIAALFASISCGIIGTYIVTRRIVFISGGIGHASFSGLGVAYFFGFNPIIGAAVSAVLIAILIEFISEKTSVRKDSMIGITWSLGMAVGIFFVHFTPGYMANLMTYLFGNILTVTALDLKMMALVTLSVILVFYFLYKEILFITFSQEYAKTQAIPVKTINYILSVLVAMVIVINIRMVGIILVISLLTIPQATANLFCRHFKTMMIFSTIIAFVASLTGLVLSYYINVPSGATIIFTTIIFFFVSYMVISIIKKIKQKRLLAQ